MSIYLEDSFPCFKIPHYPLDTTHAGFYTLFPAIDHKKSIFYDGSNELENIITASQTLNIIKSCSSLEELNWDILETNKLDIKWDGGRKWFLKIISDKAEFEKIICKAKSLGTFHTHINPEKYFTKWKNAILSYNQNENSFIKINKSLVIKQRKSKDVKKASKDLNVCFQKFEILVDLKKLSVGTICRNASTQNRYVILCKTKEVITYYSDNENFAQNIKTKPLNVYVELQLEPLLLSIMNVPSIIYNAEQLQFIKKAILAWNKNINSLRPTNMLAGSLFNTIFN